MYRLGLFLFIFCLLPFSKLYAQANKLAGFGIEANVISGKIIRHSAKFTAPVPPMSGALDVNFVWQSYGKREWHQRCNFPKTGIGLTYTDYGDNRVFGKCVGIYPNIEIPLYHKNNFEWTLRIGNGLGYVTRKYQVTEPVDTVNTAIGTHLNDFAIFMTDVRYHFNQHWHLQLGANFTHISNGDYHQPNLGVNMAGIHLGVQYYPVTCKPQCIIRELPKPKNYWVVDVKGSISYKEARAKGNPILPTYIGALYAGRRWHGKNKVFLGIDYAYHNDVCAFLHNYGIDEHHEMGHSWDGAVFAGDEYLIGRLGLVGQIGVYYRQTFLKFDPFYEKFGGNLYIVKRQTGPVKEVFLSAMLLVHGIVAEYSEVGLGFGF